MSFEDTAEYNPTLPALTATAAGIRNQAEKDGTLRAGLRPRGLAAGTTGVLYRGGIVILTAGAYTMKGEDDVSTGSLTLPAGLTIVGPVTVTVSAATFLAYL
jgi:hypothetical protein